MLHVPLLFIGRVGNGSFGRLALRREQWLSLRFQVRRRWPIREPIWAIRSVGKVVDPPRRRTRERVIRADVRLNVEHGCAVEQVETPHAHTALVLADAHNAKGRQRDVVRSMGCTGCKDALLRPRATRRRYQRPPAGVEMHVADHPAVGEPVQATERVGAHIRRKHNLSLLQLAAGHLLVHCRLSRRTKALLVGRRDPAYGR
mmetsp:Transcript_7751/g.15515  ORF Transcript_7751/g.15515 Transcript_7751/m.15515 type:complete len:202 (+) Transcript_7751:184-789(+)